MNKWVTDKKISSEGNLELHESPKGDVESGSTETEHLIHDQDVTLNFWRWVMRKQVIWTNVPTEDETQ